MGQGSPLTEHPPLSHISKEFFWPLWTIPASVFPGKGDEARGTCLRLGEIPEGRVRQGQDVPEAGEFEPWESGVMGNPVIPAGQHVYRRPHQRG